MRYAHLASSCLLSTDRSEAETAEAFRCVLSGQADKHLVQVFKNRYTSFMDSGFTVLSQAMSGISLLTEPGGCGRTDNA